LSCTSELGGTEEIVEAQEGRFAEIGGKVFADGNLLYKLLALYVITIAQIKYPLERYFGYA
jgi:hypothetical protein